MRQFAGRLWRAEHQAAATYCLSVRAWLMRSLFASSMPPMMPALLLARATLVVVIPASGASWDALGLSSSVLTRRGEARKVPR